MTQANKPHLELGRLPKKTEELLKSQRRKHAVIRKRCVWQKSHMTVAFTGSDLCSEEEEEEEGGSTNQWSFSVTAPFTNGRCPKGIFQTSPQACEYPSATVAPNNNTVTQRAAVGPRQKQLVTQSCFSCQQTYESEVTHSCCVLQKTRRHWDCGELSAPVMTSYHALLHGLKTRHTCRLLHSHLTHRDRTEEVDKMDGGEDRWGNPV